MKKLFAPWRDKYATDIAYDELEKLNTCVFCAQLKEKDDEKYFILGRFKYNFVIMNKYPYNAGHLLIIPNEHLDSLNKIEAEARTEMIDLVNKCTTLLEKELKTEGINIGINQGKASGAGIPEHLHAHVLPRWFGDTNFLPTIANTKQISTDMVAIYNKLKPYFK
jgi:ATP adenylyltransferase